MQPLPVLIWSAIAAIPAIAGCAPSLGTPTATATDANSMGELVVSQTKVGDGFYIEGAVAFIEVRDEEGSIVAQTQTNDYHLSLVVLRAVLPSGAYTLTSYLRPCAAACPHMDPPTDACVADVAITSDTAVAVLIERRIGQPCTVIVQQ